MLRNFNFPIVKFVGAHNIVFMYVLLLLKYDSQWIIYLHIYILNILYTGGSTSDQKTQYGFIYYSYGKFI